MQDTKLIPAMTAAAAVAAATTAASGVAIASVRDHAGAFDFPPAVMAVASVSVRRS